MRRRHAAALALVLGGSLLLAGCTDDPAGADPAAPEPSVEEAFRPDGCTLPEPEVDRDTVTEVIYGIRSEPLPGLTLESSVAVPDGDEVRLTVRRTAPGCRATAKVTGPVEHEYDVLGLRLDVGRPTGSEGGENRAQTPVRIVAAH